MDATASVGGNVLHLARDFPLVHAIEVDPARHAMLQHNVGVALDAKCRRRVKTSCADALEALPALLPTLPRPFVVFADPPWGGLAYKKKDRGAKQLTLTLGGRSLADFAELCARGGASSVYFKLPFNAALPATDRATEAARHALSPKVAIAALHFAPAASSDQPR